MYKVKGNTLITPEQAHAHERKVLDAMLWMRNRRIKRVDRVAHADAITAQVKRVQALREKENG